MSDEREHLDLYRPGPALPDPTIASGPTRLTRPTADYATGTPTWADAVEPATVPPVVAEGPQTRPGWLLAGRVVKPDPAR